MGEIGRGGRTNSIMPPHGNWGGGANELEHMP